MSARLRRARRTVRAWPMLRAAAAVAATTALRLAVTSCGSPRAGGTLRIAADTDPGCLDPQRTGQLQTLDIPRSLVDSLTDQDPKTGTIVPWFARSWTISPDAKQFTFVRRTGYTWASSPGATGEVAR
ncbi:hypothetical protein [Frankia sp. R82]|uniref:hypothetical protein n=1 Tax=Frankia sp. R82 TaxID=2950553 RepID=UPI002043778D|nr:hypothetical protein [Frankia sp. R82]MCM3882838.1 hypothetical protein [Frankia sp. R82]